MTKKKSSKGKPAAAAKGKSAPKGKRSGELTEDQAGKVTGGSFSFGDSLLPAVQTTISDPTITFRKAGG
jgi:hypothetical protein